MSLALKAGLIGAALLALVGKSHAEDLTAQQQQRLLQHPAAFLESAATATHWFDDPRGLNAQGVQDFVAAMRASRRADVVAMLLKADLSGDGIITENEVMRLSPGLSPTVRGKLIARAGLADGNGDGAISPEELQAYAQDEALRLFPDQKAQDLNLILLFDSDGNGWVTYEELVKALKDLPSQAGNDALAAQTGCVGDGCGLSQAPAHRQRGAVKPVPPVPGSLQAVLASSPDAP